jgi:predicted O-methyltransferase YrrM
MAFTWGGANRISRFHDEKGNFVDPGSLVNALPALASALARRLAGRRADVPMISSRARRVIERLLTPATQMVEFGSGHSTPWFAARVGHLISVEDNPEWHARVGARLAAAGTENVRHELRNASNYADLSDIADASLDFVLVDGTDREGCVRSAVPKLRPGGHLYLDNTDKDMTIPGGDLRRAEAALTDAVRARRGELRYFSDFSPGNFFVEQGALARL